VDRVRVGATTTNFTVGLAIPHIAAVTLVFPAATAVTKPIEEIVAILVLELVQIVLKVMSAVEPSEKVPIALSCRVEPNTRLDEGYAVTRMEDIVKGVDRTECIGVDVVFDEDATMVELKVATNPAIRQ